MEFERIADKKRTDFILRSLAQSVPPSSIILDVGCGNGLISRALGEQGYQVTGIDVSEKTIAAARSNTHLPNVKFKVIPAGKLVAEPGKYAGIICSEVLEHLSRPQELLIVLHKSLAKNGTLIVTVPNGYGPREMFVTKPVQQLQGSNGSAWKMISTLKSKMGYTGITVQSSADDLRHIQFFSRSSLQQLAASSGFKIERIAASNFIEQVFPFSLLYKRSMALQKLDCLLADLLPLGFTSGFMSIWKKL